MFSLMELPTDQDGGKWRVALNVLQTGVFPKEINQHKQKKYIYELTVQLLLQ